MGIDAEEFARRNGGRSSSRSSAVAARPVQPRVPGTSGGGSFRIHVDVDSFALSMDQLAESAELSARPAAQAGAQVIYEAVTRNVGRLKRKTGNLAASIYQVYSKSRSSASSAVYHISWNAKKAPHGHLVEFGHLQRYEVSFDPKTKRFTTHKDRPLAAPKQIAAKPFVRPAMSSFDEAEAAMRAKWIDQLYEAGIIR